jgi:integrase/recombinase XerC
LKKSITSYKQEFLEYLEKQKGYSDLTIQTYDEALREAFSHVEFVEEAPHGMLCNLMPYRLHIAHLNPKTITKKLSAIRSFVAYLQECGEHIVLRSDESIKVAKTLPKPISHKHILEALALAQEEEYLVVLLLYTLGLRISELTSLEVANISEEWIRVIGKGSKQRDVPLLPLARQSIEKYLTKNHPKKFLFEKNSERLSENSLRYIVNKVFKRVSLKVTPHQLRHSYATALLNEGAPIADVSELLGHSSMATTQIYTKLGSVLKQQNYNKAHPLCMGDTK